MFNSGRGRGRGIRPQRIRAIVGKELRRLRRDPANLFMVILFPVLFTLIFGFAFGDLGGGEEATYEVALVEPDLGTVGAIGAGQAGQNGSVEQYQYWTDAFVENLSATELLHIVRYDSNASAQDDLSQGAVHAVLVLPSNFGASCQSYHDHPTNASQWQNATLHLSLDKGSMIVTQVVPPIVQGALAQTLGTNATAPIGPTLPIAVSAPALVSASDQSVLDFMAPGFFAFAAIFLIMTVSSSFVVERESGLLRRISTTPITPTEVMLGHVLSNMLIAVCQMAIVFALLIVVGYSPAGGLAGIIVGFIALLIFSLCCVGFGLITAAVARSPGAATGISFIFIMPQMFLGTFVTVGLFFGARAAGRFVPSYYVTDALTSLYLRGAAPSSSLILFDIAVLAVVSVAVLIVGVLLFKRYGQ